MCGRRRRQGGAYPAPMVVVLGKLAYDKYQERKSRKLIDDSQVQELPEPDVRSSMANDEILEKTRTNPPSYDELVANRAIVPEPNVKVDEKAFDWTMAKDAIDDVAISFNEDRGYGVANGMNHSSMPMPIQQRRQGCCQSRCQQKKAERAAAKAEKRAAKAAARGMVMQ